jgi:Zn-dependent peptidase ImmA (M78 family)
MRVDVKPELLSWACERGGRDVGLFLDRFPQLERWLSMDANPTLKQLEKFSHATHTPIGYLFLDTPPVDTVPIPDLRTVGNERIGHPSTNLLDTLYLCQQRQEWYRDFARSMGESPLAFVGSASIRDDIVPTAARIRGTLGFDLDERAKMPSWEDALRHFISQADDIGIMVMCSGVAKGNTHRTLDPEEFRGFALSDPLAPLVFINGKDTKSAQMFTLAHELAHIWLGESGLTDTQAASTPVLEIEQWCNRIAAEMLVPIEVVQAELRPGADLDDEVKRLARRFKVSSLVILRRIHDAGGLSREAFWDAFEAEHARLVALVRNREPGGDYYRTQSAGVSKRFARAVIAGTWEGRCSFTEAFSLLGCKKMSTFRDFGHKLGMSF